MNSDFASLGLCHGQNLLIVLSYRRKQKQKLGSHLTIIAGVLNVFQIIADQLHLMKPENEDNVIKIINDLSFE